MAPKKKKSGPATAARLEAEEDVQRQAAATFLQGLFRKRRAARQNMSLRPKIEENSGSPARILAERDRCVWNLQDACPDYS